VSQCSLDNSFNYTNDEKPGSGALDLAMLFMMIWPPFRLTTALPSGSESVYDE